MTKLNRKKNLTEVLQEIQFVLITLQVAQDTSQVAHNSFVLSS